MSISAFGTSPPLVGFAATVVKMFRAVPIAYWAMDLNPDQLIAMGKIREKSLAARLPQGVASTAAPAYTDGAVRMFTLAAVLWGVVGMAVVRRGAEDQVGAPGAQAADQRHGRQLALSTLG